MFGFKRRRTPCGLTHNLLRDFLGNVSAVDLAYISSSRRGMVNGARANDKPFTMSLESRTSPEKISRSPQPTLRQQRNKILAARLIEMKFTNRSKHVRKSAVDVTGESSCLILSSSGLI